MLQCMTACFYNLNACQSGEDVATGKDEKRNTKKKADNQDLVWCFFNLFIMVLFFLTY